MAIQSQEREPDYTFDVSWIPKVAHRSLVRFMQMSFLALIVLLVSESARTRNELFVIGVIILVAVLAIIDVFR